MPIHPGLATDGALPCALVDLFKDMSLGKDLLLVDAAPRDCLFFVHMRVGLVEPGANLQQTSLDEPHHTICLIISVIIDGLVRSKD